MRWLCWIWLALALAQQAPPPGVDLSGTWKLDSGASEPIDELLKARGVGWMERQAMALLPTTWVIEQRADAVQVSVVAPGYERTDVYPSDGQARTLPPDKDKDPPQSQRCFWEGPVFVVETRVTLEDGAPATWTVRRSLIGTATLVYDAQLRADDGRSWTARRIFWRVPNPEG